MPRNKEQVRNRLKVVSFLVLLFGGATFLLVTDNDEGPSLWQRWTSSAVVADGTKGSLLRQISAIDLPGPKGKRFDYLTIDPSRHLLLSTHLGAGLLYAIDLRTNKLVKTFEVCLGLKGWNSLPTSTRPTHQIGKKTRSV